MISTFVKGKQRAPKVLPDAALRKGVGVVAGARQSHTGEDFS
jgi:hypothetical protein